MATNYQWIKVADDYELPALVQEGKLRTITVDGKKICLAYIKQQYYAIADKCPHAGGSLGSGWCTNDFEAVCPLHRIRFDLRNGKNTSGEGYYVNSYPTKIENGHLYIGFVQKSWWPWA